MNRNALSARFAAVEQVLEVAQPHALLVEQVVVLAAAVQPAPELEHAVLHRQQPVGVVEDERHVGHALGAALLGARPDDVLALADAERAALLAERPAERVREVRLARAVGPDHRADPGPELDQGPLGERLEALDAEAEEAGRGGHDAGSPSASGVRRVDRLALGEHGLGVAGAALAALTAARAARAARRSALSTSSAWAAADVSATRREGPSPVPRTRPSTSTSIRNRFSWSGPTASRRW